MAVFGSTKDRRWHERGYQTMGWSAYGSVQAGLLAGGRVVSQVCWAISQPSAKLG